MKNICARLVNGECSFTDYPWVCNPCPYDTTEEARKKCPEFIVTKEQLEKIVFGDVI